MKLIAIFITLLAVLLIQISAQAIPPIPDSKVTPGELCDTDDPDFAQLRYEEKIAWCQRNVSNKVKHDVYEQYQIPEKCRRNYTIDHFIPLAVGGNNSVHNLWPEHKKIKALRESLETQVYAAMEYGEIQQEQAIDMIVEAKMNPPKQAFDLKDPCEKSRPR